MTAFYYLNANYIKQIKFLYFILKSKYKVFHYLYFQQYFYNQSKVCSITSTNIFFQISIIQNEVHQSSQQLAQELSHPCIVWYEENLFSEYDAHIVVQEVLPLDNKSYFELNHINVIIHCNSMVYLEENILYKVDSLVYLENNFF